jgi:RimJ/RimL family protein N-acetyltransferase
MGKNRQAWFLTLLSELNLNRVELDTFDFNKRAQKCYLKVGFKEVGIRRKARFIDGEYRDDIIMDILRDEWLVRSKGRKKG